VGWAVGAGVEGVVSGNWTAKIEYLYIDLRNVSGSFTTPIVAPSGAFLTSSYTSHITDNILRVGLNYKLGSPVVAKHLAPLIRCASQSRGKSRGFFARGVVSSRCRTS
jgi:outer membrane immunogenic protein